MLLSARETADRLGVKLDTLYAYVSRGLLRSVEIADSRERHYDADTVERFRAGRGSRGHTPAETLSPVIGSAICLIENHRLYYRGEDALCLAESATLEDVAAILWEDQSAPHPNPLPARRARVRAGALSPRPVYGERVPTTDEGPGEAGKGQPAVIESCQIRLARQSAANLAALDLSRTGVIRTGRLILAELAACVAAAEPSRLAVHQQLASAWRLDAAGADIVRRCLVLLADHEL